MAEYFEPTLQSNDAVEWIRSPMSQMMEQRENFILVLRILIIVRNKFPQLLAPLEIRMWVYLATQFTCLVQTFKSFFVLKMSMHFSG